MFTVVGFHYEPTSEVVISGFKRGAIPKNHSRVRGRNGCYAIGDDPQLILHFENEKGKVINTDIAPDLRDIAKLDGKKVSEKRATYVANKLQNYKSKDGQVEKTLLKSLFEEAIHHTK